MYTTDKWFAILLAACLATTTQCSIDIENEIHLKLIARLMRDNYYYPTLPVDDFDSNANDASIPNAILQSLGYIPLPEQPFHFSYYKEGFPRISEMMTAPDVIGKKGRTYPALPTLDFSDNNVIALPFPAAMVDDPDIKSLMDLCLDESKYPKHAYIDALGCMLPGTSMYKVLFCKLRTSTARISALIDMLGFIASKLVGNTNDVYMYPLGATHQFLTNISSIETLRFRYQEEAIFPRVMWPAWVNLYLSLRSSYDLCNRFHVCMKGRMKSDIDTKCANLFPSVNQLSLTYAYFVCRFLKGNAADGLCPVVCRNDPCSRINHAMRKTCQIVGFGIHQFDYFCFCEDGYIWTPGTYGNSETGFLAGKCELETERPSEMKENCTCLEFKTFCNVENTAYCSIDRMSDNHRPTCHCRPGYFGTMCHFKPQNACQLDGFKGYILCRSHQPGIGKCLDSPTDPKKYRCMCTSANYLRWSTDDNSEECLQWVPSVWQNRAQRCGYYRQIANGTRSLSALCNLEACTDHSLVREIAVYESLHACNGRGICQPAPRELTSAYKLQSYCACDDGFTGQLCDVRINFYPEWTPWTICYDKGIVDPHIRITQRYRKCRQLMKFSNGSAPVCIGGETQKRACPNSIPEDYPNILTPADYGVASQAVMSMWRVVELMLLIDVMLVGVLASLLVYHRADLQGRLLFW